MPDKIYRVTSVFKDSEDGGPNVAVLEIPRDAAANLRNKLRTGTELTINHQDAELQDVRFGCPILMHLYDRYEYPAFDERLERIEKKFDFGLHWAPLNMTNQSDRILGLQRGLPPNPYSTDMERLVVDAQDVKLMGFYDTMSGMWSFTTTSISHTDFRAILKPLGGKA